jgi:integrase
MKGLEGSILLSGRYKLPKAAEVRDGRLHDARHTAATVLLLLGVHERTIMSIGMVNDGDGKPLRTRRCSDS